MSDTSCISEVAVAIYHNEAEGHSAVLDCHDGSAENVMCVVEWENESCVMSLTSPVVVCIGAVTLLEMPECATLGYGSDDRCVTVEPVVIPLACSLVGEYGEYTMCVCPLVYVGFTEELGNDDDSNSDRRWRASSVMLLLLTCGIFV